MKSLHLVTNPSSFFEDRLDSLRARGHRCDVVNVPGREMDDRAERMESSRSVGDYARFYRRVLGRVGESYDIVHAHYGLTAPFALAQPHRPVVLTLWGSDLMGDLGWASQRFAALVDEVIVMSPEMAADLETESTVIPHGVDTDRFRPVDRQAARQRVGWAHDRRHVLFPYTPSRAVKNYPLAERVVERCRETFPTAIELHTVYDADPERVPTYMNAADALLLTSDREGSPNTVKEAMACNLPVVATDVGDVGERLGGVDHSFACETEDELVEKLGEVLSENERSNGRDAARELDLDRLADRVTGVYRRALAE